MAFYFEEVSHTFNEYLLIPGYSSAECTPDRVSLAAPLVRFNKREGESTPLHLNIPFTSAIMQSVSGVNLALALAREGGVSFIYGSQPIVDQAAMVNHVKRYKAGFVFSDTNVKPEQSLSELVERIKITGHSTAAVTENGDRHGKFLGLISKHDFRYEHTANGAKVAEYMVKKEELPVASDGITLEEANDIIWKNKINCLPVVNKEGKLMYLVFRQDYTTHKEYPRELTDDAKRYVVGAGINTRDYMERVPLLASAGADVFCLDSSEGFSEWQSRALKDLHGAYPAIKVGAGNVVDAEGFRFLAEAGADFVKVGIGGGSICITREQKGIGRGQATALIDVARERDAYFKETGIYVPVCSDGGIVHDYQITLALAMGADFVMLGRYFARFDESPSHKLIVNGNYVKEYWGEGSKRARNWQRYDVGGKSEMAFEEGVDSYVPYAGALHDNVEVTVSKIIHTMCNCGALSIEELQKKAKLTLVSSASIREGGAHDVIVKNTSLGAR